MCTIIEAINAFKQNNRNIIDESKLVYDWKCWDDESTTKLFKLFHKDLITALRCKTDDSDVRIKKVIRRILIWGGIKSNENDSLDIYIEILRALKNNNQWRERPTSRTIVSQEHPVGTRQQTPLPSWTKILAAYKPKHYCIYDARVAVALRIVCPDKKWFLPHSSATYSKVAKALIDYFKQRERREQEQQHRRIKQLSQRESYDEYLDLLRETGDSVKFERTLFMLVDSIPTNMQNGIQYINFIMNDGQNVTVDIPQD